MFMHVFYSLNVHQSYIDQKVIFQSSSDVMDNILGRLSQLKQDLKEVQNNHDECMATNENLRSQLATHESRLEDLEQVKTELYLFTCIKHYCIAIMTFQLR